MGKQVFKIIAIVLGCVTAFVGAVVGVMALMGKFKTPTVPPEELIFIDDELEIIDMGETDDIFSFTLTGLSKQEHEVNQKDCKIWFVEGGDLITLCNQNGEPLTSVQNKYMVRCNELIYYKINPVTSNEMLQGQTFGKVVLRAWDAKDQVSSNNLTIWIDRNIDAIQLNHSAEVIDSSQNVELGVDVKQYFEYTTTPTYALYPFSKEDAKVVETYVLTNSDGYIPLEEAYLRDDCKDFIHKEASTGKFYFESAVSRSTPFQFKIAVFPTYKAKMEYEESEQAATNSNSERINSMVNVSLNIMVVNSEVSSVGFNSTGVALNLFSNNNYLTLNSTSGVAGANDNNLKLFMIRDGKRTEIRFNEVDFLLANQETWVTGAQFAKFIGDDVNEASKFVLNQTSIEAINTENKTITAKVGNNLESVTFSYTLGSVSYGNKTLMTSLIHTTEGENPITTTYYCSSGLAFLKEDATNGNSICSINSGSYLDFYIYNQAEATYTQVGDRFNYSINSIAGSGAEKTFNLTAKNIPALEEGESLVIGVLVSNITGGKTPLFASVSATVSEVELDFGFVDGKGRVLNIDYEKLATEPTEPVEYKTVYGELHLNDIITINKGSHSTCIFVTPKLDDVESYNVKVLPNATLKIAGNTYVVVGYFDSNDRFVNAVSPKEETESRLGAVHNSTTSLFVVQLLTEYDADGNLKTVADLIAEAIESAQKVEPANEEEGEGGETPQVPPASIGETTLTLGSLENKPAGATGYIVIGNNFINAQNLITIGIKYAYNPETISCYYETDEDVPLQVFANKIVALENSEMFNLVLKSTIPNMLKNIFVDAADFKARHLSVDFYEDENTKISAVLNNLEIGMPILDPSTGNISISFVTNEPFANKDYFAKINLSYENMEVVSTLPIYIQDSTPQNILFVLDETPEDLDDAKTIITLAKDAPTSAEPTNNEDYIKITKYYSETTFEIKHSICLVAGGTERLIGEEFAAIFNSTASSKKLDNGQFADGFVPVREDFNIDSTLTYSSTDLNVLNLVNETTSVGNAVLSITANDKVTRYIKVAVVGEGFNLTSNFNPELAAETEELNLSQPQSVTETAPMVQYTYTAPGKEAVNLATGLLSIDIHDITILKFGAGESCEVVYANGENALDGYNIQTTNENPVVVLKIGVVNNQWVLSRQGFKHAELQLSIKLTASTTKSEVTLVITFASNIEYAINQNWEVVRCGTTALVYEERNNKANLFENESIVRVTNVAGGTISYQLKSPSAAEASSLTQSHYMFNEVGTYTLSILYDGETLASRNITVLPNALLSTEDIHVQSATTYNNLFVEDNGVGISFKCYKTEDENSQAIVYGKKLPDGKIPMYGSIDEQGNSVYLIDLLPNATSNVIENIYFSVPGGEEAENNLLSFSENALTAGWINVINATRTGKIIVSYIQGANNIQIGTVDVTIKNKYQVVESSVIEENSNLMVQTPIECPQVELVGGGNDFAITSVRVSVNGEESLGNLIEVIKDVGTGNWYFTIKTDLQQPLLNKTLTVVFCGGNGSYINKELHYTTNAVNLMPYLPSLVEESKAYSGTSFDFLNDVFNTIEGIKIKSIKITEIDSGTLLNATVDSLGLYSNSASEYSALATLAEIAGDSKTVNVTYQIEYVSGVVYNYVHTLIILNRQTLTLNVPFKNAEESSTFTIPSSATFIALTDDEFVAAGNMAEPVLINQSITFNFDDRYSMYRAMVKDAQFPYTQRSVQKVELVGFQNKPSANNYYDSRNIIISGNSVTFNHHSSFGSGTYAYFVFKITTESGAFGFYYVYLYNQLGSNEFDNVSLENGSANYQATNNQFLTQAGGKTTDIFGVNVANLLKIDADNNNSASVPTGTGGGVVNFYILSADSNDGTSLFDLTYESTDLEGNPIQVPYITKGQKIDATTQLPELYNYATIKIAKVYIKGNTKFCFGVDSFFLKPTVTEQVLADFNLVNYGAGESIKTGHYSTNLSFATKESVAPFEVDGFELEGAEIANGEEIETIVTIDTFGKLTFNKMVTTDLNFVVKYTYVNNNNSFVLFVHYTFKAANVNTSDEVASVGEFSAETGFNNRYYLTWLGKPDDADGDVTAYNGVLMLSVNDEEAQLTYVNGGQSILADATTGETLISYYKDESYANPIEGRTGYYYLEFAQTIKALEYRLKFTYATIEDSTTKKSPVKMVTVKVASGLYSAWSGALGKSESTPYSNYSADNADFTKEVGSTLTFNNLGENNLYNAYSVGNLTLYSTTELDALTLNVEWANEYVLASNGVEDEKTGKILKKTTINDTKSTLTFAHSALANNVASFKITPMAGDSKFLTRVNEQEVAVEIEFYVQVQQTYRGLEAVHYVVDSNYENVKQNSTFTLADFFTYNEASTRVTDVANNNEVVNPYRVAIVDTQGSRVVSSEKFNPNVMGLMTANNPNYIYWSLGEGITETEKNVSLQFMEVDQNTQTTVVLYNATGVECAYTFQIMATNEPITLAEGVVGGVNGYYYATKVITDKENSKEYITPEQDAEENYIPFAVGQLNDGNTANTYLTQMDLHKNGTTNSEQISVTRGNVPANNGTPSAVAYSVVHKQTEGINLTLILYIYENGEIKAQLIRNAGYSLFSQLKYTFTLYANNGITPMLECFELHFYNYNIQVVYAAQDATQDIIYAGNTIKLSSKTNVTNNANPLVALNSINTKPVSGLYVLNGISTELTSLNIAENNLFNYNAETGILQTNAVAYDAILILNFEVEQAGYKIANLTYNAQILVNYNFKVNGESLLTGNNYFVTNYLLTKANLTGGIFPHNDNLDSLDSTIINDTANTYHGYYTNLSLGLYDASGTVKKDFSESVFTITSNNPVVTIDYIKAGEVNLKFTQDYTGPIQLTLAIKTEGNGTYKVYWNLNVVGFMSFKYSSEVTGENTIQTNSNEGFTSNQEVYLISSASTALGAVGISPSYEGSEELNKIAVKLAYVVSNEPATAQIDAKKAFDAGTETVVTGAKFDANNRSLVHTLPLVTQSEGPKYINYFVIYKIELTYLGQTRILYATYWVHNPAARVAVNKTSYTVDDLMGTQLNLFYYKEVFTVDSYKYSIVYSGENSYTLHIGDAQVSSSDGIHFDTYTFSRTNGYSIAVGAGDARPATHSVEAHSTNSMFSANYSDVVAFANFINQIKTVQLSDMSEGNATGQETIEYTFKSLGNGNWGVDLNKGNKLFNNNLYAKLSVLSNAETQILSNNNFMLSAENTLKAKGKTYKLSQIFQSGEWQNEIDTDHEIIGFGDAQSYWVEGATSVSVENVVVGTINYGGQQYSVQEATYSTNSGNSGLYSTSKKFYYITANHVIALDFANSSESYFFYITEMQADGSMQINLGSSLKKYSGGGNITCTSITPTISEQVKAGESAISTILDNNSGSATVKVSAETLQEFADAGKTSITINYTVTAEGVAINFKIQFSLRNILVASNEMENVTVGNTYPVLGRLENETDADVIMSLVKLVDGFALTSADGTYSIGSNVLARMDENGDGVAEYFVKEITYTAYLSKGSSSRTFYVLVKNPTA